MSAPTTFREVAPRINENGYRVVPIAPGEKYPGFKNWQKFAYTAGCESRYPKCGAGVLADKTPGVDIDVADEELVAKLEEMARNICGIAESAELARRVGRWPRVLLPFRTETPFKKKQTALYRLKFAPDEKPSKVEILASGQQWVAYHIHPDTKKAYEWNGHDLLNTPWSELPLITGAMADKIISEADQILAEYGERVEEERKELTPNGVNFPAGGKIVEGGRNQTLASLAGVMQRRGMTTDAIVAALRAENAARCNPPLADAEVAAIAKSVARYEPSGDSRKVSQAHNRSPLNWSDLATRDPPARRWATKFWWGFNHCTLMPGQSGIGKTLLAQQWLSAQSLGRLFIDESAGPIKCLMWACEDDHDELWRRQVDVARWLGVGIEAFVPNLVIEPRAGLENVLVAADYGRLLFTPQFEELRQQAGDYRAEVVVLDNVAQIYGAGENDRHQVTAFLNALIGALPGRAILLLAHPARSVGSEYSGSSAWEAVCRTRLYLGARLPDQKPDPDEEPTESVRYLSRRKANYSARDWRRFEFRDGVLVPDAAEAQGGIVGHIRDQTAERVLLDGLKRLQGMQIRATEGTRSPQYLPRLLTDYKLTEGCTKPELAGAMRRLMLAGRLQRVVVGQYGSNRTPMHGLSITE